MANWWYSMNIVPLKIMYAIMFHEREENVAIYNEATDNNSLHIVVQSLAE